MPGPGTHGLQPIRDIYMPDKPGACRWDTRLIAPVAFYLCTYATICCNGFWEHQQYIYSKVHSNNILQVDNHNKPTMSSPQMHTYSKKVHKNMCTYATRVHKQKGHEFKVHKRAYSTRVHLQMQQESTNGIMSSKFTPSMSST